MDGWVDRWVTEGWMGGASRTSHGLSHRSSEPYSTHTLHVPRTDRHSLSTRLIGHQNCGGQLPVFWSTVCLQLEHRAGNSGIRSQGLSRLHKDLGCRIEWAAEVGREGSQEGGHSKCHRPRAPRPGGGASLLQFPLLEATGWEDL